MSHKYRLKYDFDAQHGEFSKEEIVKEGKGGTDALLLASILYPEDGSLSIKWLTVDGRNEGKPLQSVELFKFWSMLTKYLSEQPDLSDGKRAFCADVFETIRMAIVGRREEYSDVKKAGVKPFGEE